MTRISIITQNFSSPNDFSDTPLMLLPQAPPTPPTLNDRDQEGFSQLLLHDRNRQRQSYVQSFTAFETLRKRQDFVLRQESLRSLQSFVEHMATKQDQNIDQSFHSYKQCFGKFINVKSSTNRNLQEQQKRPKTAGPSFNQFHMQQLSQVPATPLDPPAVIPFHRYQKSQRPSTSTRYRSNASSFRSTKMRHDPFRTTSFMSHSQPFFSFTENYFHKHNDRPSSKSPISRNNINDRPSSKSPVTKHYNNDRISSKSPISRNNNNDRLTNKPQITRNDITDRPSSKSQMQRSNNEDQPSTKIPITTNNHDDEPPINTFQIVTNNNDDRQVDEFQVTTNNDDDQPSSRSQITTNTANDRSADDFQITTTNTEDRPPSRPQMATHTASTNIIDDQVVEYIRPTSAGLNLLTNQNIKQEKKFKIPNTQHSRVTPTPRITTTPSTTPQMGYNDAVQDGLVITKADEDDHNDKKFIVNQQRPSSQQSHNQLINSNNTLSPKRPKTAKKKHTIFVDLSMGTKVEPITTEQDDNISLEKAITVQNYVSNPPDQNSSSKIKRRKLPTSNTSSQLKKTPSVVVSRPSVKFKDDSTEIKDHIETQMTTTVAVEHKEQPIINPKKDEVLTSVTNIIEENKQESELVEVIPKRVKKGAFDSNDTLTDKITSEIKMLGSHRGIIKKTKSHVEKENKKNPNEVVTKSTPENQATLDLLEKIKESATGISIGKMSISKQGCRFELPYDLKILENLTLLDYISKYCRLSKHRNYQFKRIFEKYRNGQYRLDLSNLYAAIIDIHTDNFTRTQYEYLCQLIDIQNEQQQFTFNAFAGILAVCERIVYDSLNASSDAEVYELAKDPLEKCDFDSLDRKLDGFSISDAMKKLLKTL